MTQKRLSKTDWLKGAFRALTIGGPTAIKVESIAKDLHVSKGSFYWHFANLSALKVQMISHWEKQATQAIMIELEHFPGNAKQKLETLVLLSTSENDTEYGGPKVEIAIRDWARYDDTINKIVERIDDTRINYVEKLFKQNGFSQDKSQYSAKILYASLLGLQLLSDNDNIIPQNDLSKLLSFLLNK